VEIMSSRRVGWAVLALVAVLAAPAPAVAEDSRVIVRIKGGLAGLPVIQTVCALVGCTVESSLDTAPEDGPLQPSSLFLVRLPVHIDVNVLLNLVSRLLGVVSIELDLPVAVAEAPTADESSPAVQDYLWRRTPVDYFGATVWEGYLQQPATSIVRLHEAQCDLRATGGGVVAVIDTGVDPEHPALAPRLVGGWDFTRNRAGGDERTDLNQASAAVLDGSGTCRVNQASAAVLDQASAAVLDGRPEYAAYGHGTMVSGVVALVAPHARIMPLKAFRADGTGRTSDILRAIYYASNRGAKVINMSFSRPTHSPELARALDYARLRGAIPVSSAGNDGAKVLRYPAALSTVMGVASTSNQDVRSYFSNYGSTTVYLAAPGEGIITTYPGSTYAATWGTSFSTPIASGTAALLVGLRSYASYTDVSWALAQAQPVPGELGYGRVDVTEAVQAARSRWNLTGVGPGPAVSCEAY
jgi:subtilisin family serine protease